MPWWKGCLGGKGALVERVHRSVLVKQVPGKGTRRGRVFSREGARVRCAFG